MPAQGVVVVVYSTAASTGYSTDVVPTSVCDGVTVAGAGQPPPAPPPDRHDDWPLPLASGGGLPSCLAWQLDAFWLPVLLEQLLIC